MNLRSILPLAFVWLSAQALAQTAAYCHVTDIETKQLSNGVQITIKADGFLEYSESYDYATTTSRLELVLSNAKSKINRTFIDVSKYPVSYVQLSVPQSAKEGVGLVVSIALFEASPCNVQRSNDLQSLIVTVDSNRTLVARGGGGRTNGVATPASMDVKVKDGRVSVTAVKSALDALVAFVAHKANVSAAVDDSVKGRTVSIAFADLPLDDALRAIAGGSGLALSKINGVYMVSDGTPTDLATYHLAATESFAMKSTKAQDASGLLPTFLYSFLHVNEAQNAVVVTAPSQMLDKIRADFKKIDLAPPQIMIEALAVEVSSTEDLDAGLKMTYEDGSTSASSDSKTGDITYSTIGTLPSDFQARLKALVTKGKAKVRAAPRMASVNGRSADIFIGDTKFIKVEVTSYGGKQERIQGVDVGVKLSVRPWTGGNGEITVTLSPEVSNITETERETGMPVLSTRRAGTTVRVKDGETIMIGGLTQRQDYVTRSKVPFLGDLPLLGRLFQSSKASSIQTELVIFVTPHILTDRGRLKDDAKEEATRKKFL